VTALLVFHNTTSAPLALALTRAQAEHRIIGSPPIEVRTIAAQSASRSSATRSNRDQHTPIIDERPAKQYAKQTDFKRHRSQQLVI
jgi:hypothetical protein